MQIHILLRQIGIANMSMAERLIRQRCWRVLRATGQQVLVDDAVQRTWVRIIRAVQNGQGPKASPAAWLRTVSTNETLNLMRDQRRHTEAMEFGDEMDTLASLLEDSSRLTWRSLMHRLFALLSERQSKIFKLALFQMTQAEIAQELGLSPALVCNELKAIKKIIDNLWGPDDDRPSGNPADRPPPEGNGPRSNPAGASAAVTKQLKKRTTSIMHSLRVEHAARAEILALPAFAEIEGEQHPLTQRLSSFIHALPAFRDIQSPASNGAECSRAHTSQDCEGPHAFYASPPTNA